MADEGEIVVNLPDDLSGPLVDQVLQHQSDDADDGKGTGAKKTETENDDPLEDLRGQLSTLKTQNVGLSSQLASTAARAEAAEREVGEARHTVADSNYDTIVSGINAARAEADAAEIAYRDAAERGDFAAQSKAQREMARAESRITPLEMAKAELESERKARPKATEREPQQRPQAGGDPVESYLASRTPKSAQWLRNGRTDYITDQSKNNKLIAAHYHAVGEGIQPDSTEYFEHLEQQLGLKKVVASDKRQQTTVQRRPSAPSAPVNGSGGGVNGGKSEVRLSAKEAQSATDGTLQWNYDDPSGQKRFKKGDPIGIAEFARRKSKMQAEGLYDKTLTE
jgi:hypothetical protein